ncbi:MAG: tRNA (adenosine(37)-N6)-threonylcarbamoyltransferase complex dimerization subunit type 1 TsaB [Pyrinomonadaceae bacterium]
MTLILSVETATRAGSLAILDGERVLWQGTGDNRVSHSAALLLEVNEGIKRAGIRLSDVSVFAVATGPGSFTGLRTGLATVMGLAWTLERQVVGVPTLHAVACAEANFGEAIIALLAAGRGELFAQTLELTSEGEINELDAPTHVSPQKLLESERAGRSTLKWAGDGARGHVEEIRARAARDEITLVDEREGCAASPNRSGWTLAKASVDVLAVHVAMLGLRAFRRGEVLAASELRANYVRPSDAELKEQCREQS